ncbi:hypothetical protein [Lactiplantibacillus xiangfangensis]|uniref:Uncharacterized protein n=1 Tax=Lactiplantibacillus xiangfangensis TaxID=942150 RepID=A0A0R2MQP2_9LACO|nr:hypothetical protein [Lactiplantibacillus xiangfangensis]KRO14610.1 hypothetical protein IV64_GL001010 [Lactiplantibacillus xiangfangensis]
MNDNGMTVFPADYNSSYHLILKRGTDHFAYYYFKVDKLDQRVIFYDDVERSGISIKTQITRTFMRDLVKAIDWHPVGNSIIVEIYNVRREESKGTRLACDI